MRHLRTFSTFLAALALQSAAWAEIYETTDAQGNPEFTDSPPGPGAEVINLQKTNIINAPQNEPQQVSAPQSVAEEQAPEQENHTVILHDGDDNDDEPYDEYLHRERAFDRADPAAPDQSLDAESPREVGDSNSQMPHEVGDFDTQMPEEVGDNDMPVTHEGSAPATEHRVIHSHRR